MLPPLALPPVLLLPPALASGLGGAGSSSPLQAAMAPGTMTATIRQKRAEFLIKKGRSEAAWWASAAEPRGSMQSAPPGIAANVD
jgi:hypothetical protein